MYKISDFSAKTGMPVKTLRYYDEINLLKPSYCDFFTGYRYYEDKQVWQAEKINKLKEIDLSLEEIKLYLESNDISIIINKKKGLEKKLKEVENILSSIDKRIAYNIFNGDYKKYVEINGTKNSTTPQALEVRDNNAMYYVIEKDHEFFGDFCIFKEDNQITLDVEYLRDKPLRNQIINTLSSEYDYITFILPKESKDNNIINEIFSNVVASIESQKGYDNTIWYYNKLKIMLNAENL